VLTGKEKQKSTTSENLINSLNATARQWASRKRPYLQQEKHNFKSASMRASDKIAELSEAKLELVRLNIQLANENNERAKELHYITVQHRIAEHALKMQMLESKAASYKAFVVEM
jgi:hypothetical protein